MCVPPHSPLTHASPPPSPRASLSLQATGSDLTPEEEDQLFAAVSRMQQSC